MFSPKKIVKVSLVLTVKNEQESLPQLLTSIFEQTLKPNEIIIVDSHSSDKTIEKIKKFQKDNLSLRLIESGQVSRSEGRNLGIKKAINQIIAITDAGCVLEPKWLEKITKHLLNNSCDVVSGIYKPLANSSFEKAYAIFTSVPEKSVNANTFIPSSRSIAFKKSVWQSVGGYPQELNTCEDLIFVKRLKGKGYRFILEKDAVVFWQQEKTVIAAFKKLYAYAFGDGMAFYLPHLTKAASVWLRYLVGFAILFVNPPWAIVLLLFYLIWAMSKGFGQKFDIKILISLPFMQILVDLAVMSGSLSGIISRMTSPRLLLK